MNESYPTYADIIDIEEKARALRAEAVRYGFSQVTKWVKAAFSLGGAVQSATAKPAGNQHA